MIGVARAVLVMMASAVLVASPDLQTQPPARDAARPATGSGRLSGMVVSDETPAKPIRRAIVTLSGSQPPLSRSVVTDDDGRFTFAGLPAGRFTLLAVRKAFITSAFGATRPGRPGTPVSLEAGDSLTDLTIRMARGAVITGVVTDEAGHAVPGVTVWTRPGGAPAPAGQPLDSAPSLTAPVEASVTDDRGVYRIFGLAAGSYTVVANFRGSWAEDMAAMSEAEVDAALRELQRRRGRVASALPGTAAADRASPTAAPPPTSPGVFRYVPIFYPATPVAADAVAITVSAGEERGGIDITIAPVRSIQP